LRFLPGGSKPRRVSGEVGETVACRHLEAGGYFIVKRNFRCRVGEIDIVARQGETTVFVEVKERTGTSHGEGHESVVARKRYRIVQAAQLYAAQHGLGESAVRFDVVSIEWKGGRAVVRHDEGAFDADGR